MIVNTPFALIRENPTRSLLDLPGPLGKIAHQKSALVSPIDKSQISSRLEVLKRHAQGNENGSKLANVKTSARDQERGMFEVRQKET